MEKILEKAFAAYKRECKRVAFRYGIDVNISMQIPSESESSIGRKYVYLRNCNGLIAKYNIKENCIQN